MGEATRHCVLSETRPPLSGRICSPQSQNVTSLLYECHLLPLCECVLPYHREAWLRLWPGRRREGGDDTLITQKHGALVTDISSDEVFARAGMRADALGFGFTRGWSTAAESDIEQ